MPVSRYNVLFAVGSARRPQKQSVYFYSECDPTQDTFALIHAKAIAFKDALIASGLPEGTYCGLNHQVLDVYPLDPEELPDDYNHWRVNYIGTTNRHNTTTMRIPWVTEAKGFEDIDTFIMAQAVAGNICLPDGDVISAVVKGTVVN